MFDDYVRTELEYDDFKIYWHKSGCLFNEVNCKLLWDAESLMEMCAYGLSAGRIDLYIDHASEAGGESGHGENYEQGGDATGVNESDEEYSDGDDSDGSDKDYDSEGSDEEVSDRDHLSDYDDEFNQVMTNKKKVLKHKSNPTMQADDDDLNIPIAKLIAKDKPKIKEKKKESVGEHGWESDYDSDSYKIVGKESSDSSDNEAASVKKKKKIGRSRKSHATFNIRTPMKNIDFEPGLMFSDVKVLKNAIIDYAVEQQREIWFKKNDLIRVQARCRENCPWYLFASKVDSTGGFQVKTYKKDHNCVLVHKHKFLRSDWLVRKFGSKVRANPKWKLREFQQHVFEMHNLVISKNQCWLAKKLALSEIEGEIAKQYRRLYDYGAEILNSNPESTVKIAVERSDATNTSTFKRIYICFGALKLGFKEGCRKIIGLDGCFLKSYVKGELLAAIGRDGNNGMFPIAWAVVDVESTETWEWFISLLKADLELDDGHGYTLMTDQQKVLNLSFFLTSLILIYVY